jgi:hypothetical protein
MPATREQLDNYVTYSFDGPRLNRDVPATKVPFGQQARVSGVDGRFGGCLRKFYGMRLLVDLKAVAGLSGITGVSFLQEVIFQKRGAATTYRGFVVRYDANDDTDNEDVGLAYTADGGANWSYLGIHTGAASGIASTTALECAADGPYLLVAVEGKACKTVYWNGSAVVAVDSGPGAFSATLAALTKASEAEDTDYFLSGNGVYQVCWRFYSSTRGIYSAMSEPVTVFLDQPKLAKASGPIYFSQYGGDGGLMVAGDVITIGGRTFEYISGGSDVTIPAAAAATIAAHAQALADAINGDTDNCGCTARAQAASVYVEAAEPGPDGNAITLAVTEAAPNIDDLSVGGANLTGGGAVTNEYLKQCQVTLEFPDNDGVLSTYDYDDFAALFDTVDVFRSIDLGQIPAAQQGAIFYNEQSIAKTGNWETSGAWDALQVSIGIMPDTALVLLDQYDPGKDAIVAPPQSGTVARYQGMTLMAQALTENNPHDILASSLTQASPAYFTAYNERRGNHQRGRPLRFLQAGDSCFALHPGGFVHVYKSGAERPVQFVDTVNGVGLDGKYAAQILGNGVLMISGGQLRQMGGNDGNIVDLPGAGRLLADDWSDDLALYVSGGFDARLNCSFFLNSRRAEVLCLWHATGALSLLEGANFAWMTSGPDIGDGGRHRAYFVTAGGRVVAPDYAAAGSGTMFDLSSAYTLAGSATDGSDSTLTADGATFHADMAGARLYCIDGVNAGQGREIAAVDVGAATLTVADPFDEAIGYGDRFAISPVPVHITLAAVRQMDAPAPLVVFDRQKMVGASVKFQAIAGLVPGVTDTLRLGAYRNGGATLDAETAELSVSGDIDAASATFDHAVDGLDILPYLEYIGPGSSFEITDVQVLKPDSDSKRVG